MCEAQALLAPPFKALWGWAGLVSIRLAVQEHSQNQRSQGIAEGQASKLLHPRDLFLGDQGYVYRPQGVSRLQRQQLLLMKVLESAVCCWVLTLPAVSRLWEA